MGCGATKPKEPKALNSVAGGNHASKNGQNTTGNTNGAPTPILKNAKPLKSSLVQRKESKRGHSGDGAQENGGGGQASSNQGNGLMVQKSSVRWKEDHDDRDEPANKGANASPGSITPTNVTPHTTPLMASNPPTNMQPRPDTGGGGGGGGRANTLGVNGLGVLMEQNSNVSLLHNLTSPPSPRRTRSPDAVGRPDQEKGHSTIEATGLESDGQTAVSGDVQDADSEAATKIRSALRAQLARRASRGQGADAGSGSGGNGGIPPGSSHGLVSHSSSGNMIGSGGGNGPVSPGSAKNLLSGGSRKGSTSSIKGKDGTNAIVVGSTTAVLIPSSPSFVAMKRLNMNAQASTTAATAAGGSGGNTTGDSYGNSEVESHSDDSMR